MPLCALLSDSLRQKRLPIKGHYLRTILFSAGGVSRGIVEGPFEYVKVRRQVEQPWRLQDVMSGSGATIFRNSFLFTSFVVYMDLSKQIIPGGLSPFMTGGDFGCYLAS